MHQDSLRSVVYRSFVTCDDPKGVVECGTIKKSKSSPLKMEHQIKSQKANNMSDASFSSKSEEKHGMVSNGTAEEFLSPSSFQLLEVSRGAQRLNKMIDSWSKGGNNDRNSKAVAKNLLKGALDLQESLVMLSKLQEASQYMARLKKKKNEKCKGVRNDQVGIERSKSCQFDERNYQMGFQKPRLSADGSSRDCFEELREAIRDSLTRQNLLPNKDIEDKRGYLQRNMDSASDIPSTSSSQSSVTHTNNYSSTDSPLSSAAPEEKARGPNLIAKLMGLEEIPSNPLKTTHNQLKNEKFSSHRRPIFEIDLPKVRKLRSVDVRKHPEKRTLKEILETQHFTGLLKSNSVKELESYPHHPSDSYSKQRFIDNVTPIVLIKPLRGQFLESEEPYAPIFQEHGVHARMMLGKMKAKKELPSKTVDSKEGPLKPGKTSKKKDADERPVKRRSKEEGSKESKKVAEKPVEKEEKIKQKRPNQNASNPIKNHPKKKETTDRKADNNLKEVVTSRKPIEKKIVKAKNVSRSQEQAKGTAMKVRKPEHEANVAKSQISQQHSSQNDVSNRTTKTVNRTLNNRKRSLIKKEKPTSDSTTTKSTNEKVESKEDEKRNDFICEKDPIFIGNNNTSVDQLPGKEEINTSEFHVGENCNDGQSSLCNEAPLVSEYMVQEDAKFIEEESDDFSYIRTGSKSSKTGDSLKAFLSSSPAFLSHAEELFDLNVNRSTTLQIFEVNDFLVTNERLFMDCANELTERRSLPDAKMVHPLLLNWLRNSRICISLNQLLDEVSAGVETLRNYSTLAGGNLPTDNLSSMLESDLRCKGVVSGIWDLGWRNEFSTDDAEQVVNDIEKRLLSGLIDEFFT